MDRFQVHNSMLRSRTRLRFSNMIIGYLQNPYASNFSADQRRAQEGGDSPTLGNYGSENKSTTAAFGVDPESVWNTAKKWAQTAGEKVSEAEAEVWKRINGDK